jgi:Fic family protein
MSFDAHYQLVTIHPWADGNGRMSRLVMNWLQFEFGLIPSRIPYDEKEDYIKSLVATRDNDDLSIFRSYMQGVMERQLTHDIDTYQKSFPEAL